LFVVASLIYLFYNCYNVRCRVSRYLISYLLIAKKNKNVFKVQIANAKACYYVRRPKYIFICLFLFVCFFAQSTNITHFFDFWYLISFSDANFFCDFQKCVRVSDASVTIIKVDICKMSFRLIYVSATSCIKTTLEHPRR
jgi:hypothetical protein